LLPPLPSDAPDRDEAVLVVAGGFAELVDRAVAVLAQDGVQLFQQLGVGAQLSHKLADADLLALAFVYWRALEARMRKLRPTASDPQRREIIRWVIVRSFNRPVVFLSRIPSLYFNSYLAFKRRAGKMAIFGYARAELGLARGAA
jgi:hypothetical protein